MLKSKFLLLVAMLSCFGLFVVGCSQNETQQKDEDAVKIWHWMTDRQAAFETLAKKYFDETGVKVVFETYAPTDVYKNKITAAASGKLLPDIFNPISDKRELASYINAGYIADLTDAMNDGWKDVFFEKFSTKLIPRRK